MKKGFYFSLFTIPLIGLLFAIKPATKQVNATAIQVSDIVDFNIDNLNNRNFKCADFANELSTNPIVYTISYGNGSSYTKTIDSPSLVPDSLKHYMGEAGNHSITLDSITISHYEVSDESITFGDKIIKTFSFNIYENPDFTGFNVTLIDSIGEQSENLLVPYYGKINTTLSTSPIVKEDEPNSVYVFSGWSHSLEYADSDLTIYMNRTKYDKSYFSRNSHDINKNVDFQIVDKKMTQSGDLRVLVYLGRNEKYILKKSEPIYHELNTQSRLNGSFTLPNANDFVEETSQYMLDNLYEYDTSKMYNISMRGSRSSLISDLEYMPYAPKIYSKVGVEQQTYLLDNLQPVTYYARSGYHSYYAEYLDNKVVDYDTNIEASMSSGFYRYEATVDIDLFLDLSFSVENSHYVFNDDARFYIDYVTNSYNVRQTSSVNGSFFNGVNKKISFNDSSLLKLAKQAYGEDELDNWAINYMKMDDPSFIGEGTGQCLSSGLYVAAKNKLLEFDEVIRNTFVNNTIGKYDSVLNRYLAWATACGDQTPFAGSGIVSNSSRSSAIILNGNYYLIFITAMTLSSLTLVTALVLKKRKNSR